MTNNDHRNHSDLWTVALHRDRNILIGAVRRMFSSNCNLLSKINADSSSWRVGIVSRRRPSHVFAAVSDRGRDNDEPRGYLVYTGDFWLRNSNRIRTLLDLIKGSTDDGSLKAAIADATRRFVALVLDDTFLCNTLPPPNHPYVNEVRQTIVAQVDHVIAQMHNDAYRKACPLSEEVVNRALEPRILDGNNPNDDLFARLKEPPFDQGQHCLSEREMIIWLGVEFLLMKLLHIWPQVGGYGQKVFDHAEAQRGTLHEHNDRRTQLTNDEAVLRVVEAMVVPDSIPPDFVFYPLLVKNILNENERELVVGYIYALWNANQQSAIRSSVEQCLASMAPTIAALFHRWIENDFVFALSQALSESEAQGLIAERVPLLLGSKDGIAFGDSGESPTVYFDGRNGLRIPIWVRTSNAFVSPQCDATLAMLASTVATTAKLIDLERHKSLSNAAFIFAHELKNRLTSFPIDALCLQLTAGDSAGAFALAKRCQGMTRLFMGLVEVLRNAGKLSDGAFPAEWGGELSSTWPTGFNPRDHLASLEKTCRVLIRQTAMAYLDDKSKGFVLREVSGGEVRTIDLTTSLDSEPLSIPPLADKGSQAPIVALLAGLLEMVRNAVRAVVDDTKKPFIRSRFGKLHVDYSIGLATPDHGVVVTVWNPYGGARLRPDQQPLGSDTLTILQAFYGALGAVVITNVSKEKNYAFTAKADCADEYVRTSILIHPQKLRFQKGGTHGG